MQKIPMLKENWKYHLERISGVKRVTITSYPENKNLEPGQLGIVVLYGFWAQLFIWKFYQAQKKVHQFLKENKPFNIEIIGPNGVI